MQAEVQLEDVFDDFVFGVLEADLNNDILLEKAHDGVLKLGDASLELD